MENQTLEKNRTKTTALVIVVLVLTVLAAAVLLSLRNSAERNSRPQNDLWNRIKKQERILSMYETVIGAKAKDFDSKLADYDYNVADQVLDNQLMSEPGAGPGLPPKLEKMETELRAEMGMITDMIQERNDLTQEIGQMHFEYKRRLNGEPEPAPAGQKKK